MTNHPRAGRKAVYGPYRAGKQDVTGSRSTHTAWAASWAASWAGHAALMVAWFSVSAGRRLLCRRRGGYAAWPGCGRWMAPRAGETRLKRATRPVDALKPRKRPSTHKRRVRPSTGRTGPENGLIRGRGPSRSVWAVAGLSNAAFSLIEHPCPGFRKTKKM